LWHSRLQLLTRLHPSGEQAASEIDEQKPGIEKP
jgi:hypothetical protein